MSDKFLQRPCRSSYLSIKKGPVNRIIPLKNILIMYLRTTRIWVDILDKKFFCSILKPFTVVIPITGSYPYFIVYYMYTCKHRWINPYLPDHVFVLGFELYIYINLSIMYLNTTRCWDNIIHNKFPWFLKPFYTPLILIIGTSVRSFHLVSLLNLNENKTSICILFTKFY